MQSHQLNDLQQHVSRIAAQIMIYKTKISLFYSRYDHFLETPVLGEFMLKRSQKKR